MNHSDRFYEYRIRISQCPDERRFEELNIHPTPQGETIISGTMDQSALHGVLNQIRDLGLELISVQRYPMQTEK